MSLGSRQERKFNISMIANLASLYKLLSREQQRRILRLQVLVALMAFAELSGILAIGPFMALVGDMQLLKGDGTLARLYAYSEIHSPEDFLFWLGLAALSVLVVASIISMITTWQLSIYGNQVGAELSTRLYDYYMHRPWLFHTKNTSSQLTSKISQECLRVTTAIITPTLQMNAKLVMTAFIALTLLIIDPLIALVGVASFIASYYLLYRTVRKKLVVNGKKISNAHRQRFKLMNEGFGGIKDTLVLNRQEYFISHFNETSKELAKSMGINQGLSQVPRYAMELIAFSLIILLILYLLSTHQGNLGSVLPTLSVYALAGFKLLPAFQQIYTSLSQIRGNLSAFEAIHDDLEASKEQRMKISNSDRAIDKINPYNKIIKISLNDVTYQYPDKNDPALRNLSINFPTNQVIGIVGPSGSGKSTMIDILLGLLPPQKGQLIINNIPLGKSNTKDWQQQIGLVSQFIFLADSSILENIAFGLPPNRIDPKKVETAAKLAHLEELIETLPEGIYTPVGERGIQLSGGQRQRIGIARALYHDAEVLILDEATSALDGITEDLIMEAIHEFSGKKTIVLIAHRLATVQQCDVIYMMDKGCIVDQGTYTELLEKNHTFRRMARHSKASSTDGQA